MTDLVRSCAFDGSRLDELRSRVAELERLVQDRAAELARADAELAAFELRYRHEVGLLHEELDDLESAIADAELGELAKAVARGERTAKPPAPGGPKPSQPRYTTDAVRRLFRDVAKAIHPDLARDPHARDRRHALMIEANRAYAVGDEQRLRSILLAWERSPEAVQGDDAQAMRLRMERRIAQLEHQLDACAADLEQLQASEIWRLKALVDDASARGKDLVGDMVKRLKRDIMVARNRLDAILSQP